MRELTQKEIGIIQRHAKWLAGEEGGERANLQGANLQDADLQGANLAFSSWPLWCGSVGVKADDRLFAQLLFHLTRLDVSGASGGAQEAMEHIRSMAASDLFCEYRDGVNKLEG